jgi:hypothetical protein
MLNKYAVNDNMGSKIAISVLTKGYADVNKYQMLIDRNNSIFDKIVENSNYEFDVIIFHEGNISSNHQSYISSKSKLPLIFKDVTKCGNGKAFNPNNDKVNMELCPPTKLSSWFSLGYKHMCHFWAIDLFEYLSDYKYTIRIDEDVLIHKFDSDILDKIINEKIKLAVPLVCFYKTGHLDDPDVMVGLQKLTEEFYHKNNFNPNIEFKDIMGCYTNFMVIDLEHFRNNKLVQSFLQDVEDSHGIYSNRWGDASTWGIIAHALMDEPVCILDTVEYYHGSHHLHVNKK